MPQSINAIVIHSCIIITETQDGAVQQQMQETGAKPEGRIGTQQMVKQMDTTTLKGKISMAAVICTFINAWGSAADCFAPLRAVSNSFEENSVL